MRTHFSWPSGVHNREAPVYICMYVCMYVHVRMHMYTTQSNTNLFDDFMDQFSKDQSLILIRVCTLEPLSEDGPVIKHIN